MFHNVCVITLLFFLASQDASVGGKYCWRKGQACGGGVFFLGFYLNGKAKCIQGLKAFISDIGSLGSGSYIEYHTRTHTYT